MTSQTSIPAGHPKLLSELDAAEIGYTVIPHRRTETAVEEAEALGVSPDRVAKTIVLSTPAGFVRAVVPASERLDLRKVREVLDTNEVELATEEQLTGAYPDFELGAVPPLGGGEDHVLVDSRLTPHEAVLVEAGAHDASLRLRTSDLIVHTHAAVADLCHD
jgi:Ala-tRNA(Pro) deacylase